MSQEEIIILLKKHKEMSAEEIKEILQISKQAMYKSLGQLVKYGEVKRMDDSPPKYCLINA